MKKLFNHFVFLYAGWLTITLFMKEDVKLAGRYTIIAFGFAFVVAVIPFVIQKIQDYYKKDTK